ncbi:MAG: helix-turn-helix transcriptional regulator [Bacteroidales bacterium]
MVYKNKDYDKMAEIDNRLKFCQQIAELRRSAGLSQAALGEKAGIKQQNINNLENGKHSTGIDVLMRIASVLDCEICMIKNH